MALSACALGAIAINSVGLALADGASALAVPSASRPLLRGERPTLIVVPTRTTSAAVGSSGSGSTAAPTAAVPVVVANARTVPATRHDVSASLDAVAPVRFYRLSEVDAPAEPAADWALDLEALDALGLKRVAFEVLVSDRGDIVSCAVVDAPGLSAELRASLESRLRATDMKPAVRAGLRVASVRHVELYIEAGDPSDPPTPS